ncbi:hypothetical protein FXW28_04085 [Candidatus Liberibacter asiaticus]|nr:hypothetical protein FXW28_04085 [Candidatus Liberibacter asiaticus]
MAVSFLSTWLFHYTYNSLLIKTQVLVALTSTMIYDIVNEI